MLRKYSSTKLYPASLGLWERDAENWKTERGSLPAYALQVIVQPKLLTPTDMVPMCRAPVK